MQTSVTICLNLTKWPAKHTGMTFLRKEVPVRHTNPYHTTSSPDYCKMYKFLPVPCLQIINYLHIFSFSHYKLI